MWQQMKQTSCKAWRVNASKRCAMDLVATCANISSLAGSLSSCGSCLDSTALCKLVRYFASQALTVLMGNASKRSADKGVSVHGRSECTLLSDGQSACKQCILQVLT